MRPITVTMNLDNASTTKVAAAQTVLISTPLVLTAAATSGIDGSGAARILLITTTEDDSSGNLVITGTDANGQAISETISMPSSGTKVTTKAYKTVSSIVPTIAITSNISIGTVGTTLSALGVACPMNFYNRIAQAVMVEVTGTINFTVQETFDDVLAGGTAAATWKDISNLASKTATTESQADVGNTAIRLNINSYSSGATATMRIITPSNSSGD